MNCPFFRLKFPILCFLPFSVSLAVASVYSSFNLSTS